MCLDVAFQCLQYLLNAVLNSNLTYVLIQGVLVVVHSFQISEGAAQTTQVFVCWSISRFEGTKLCTNNSVLFRTS